MSASPFFSVAMPAYNAEATIAHAIESVLTQTFSDWELVIVDDGSTDHTGEIARGFAEQDSRISVVRQANAGCGAARNTAVLNSSGTYVVRFDTDDELLPEYMAEMHAFIERAPGYDIYSCNGYHVYPDGSRRLARPDERYRDEQSFTLEDMFGACHIFTIAVFSRELFDRVGGIRPDIYCEDLDFWLRSFAYAGASHCYTPMPLAIYTVSDTQMTADVERVLDCRIEIYQSLIDSGRLTAEYEALAVAAIERTRFDKVVYRRRTAVKDAIGRACGPRAAESVSRLMHASSQYLRPTIARMATPLLRRSGSQNREGRR